MRSSLDTEVIPEEEYLNVLRPINYPVLVRYLETLKRPGSKYKRYMNPYPWFYLSDSIIRISSKESNQPMYAVLDRGDFKSGAEARIKRVYMSIRVMSDGKLWIRHNPPMLCKIFTGNYRSGKDSPAFAAFCNEQAGLRILGRKFRAVTRWSHYDYAGMQPKPRSEWKNKYYIFFLDLQFSLNNCLYRENIKVLRNCNGFLLFLTLLMDVQKLHDANIVHCDINPKNICINPDKNTAYLIDFGSMRKISQQLIRSTNGYMAPEDLVDGITSAYDIFSLGVVFAELMAGYLSARTQKILKDRMDAFKTGVKDRRETKRYIHLIKRAIYRFFQVLSAILENAEIFDYLEPLENMVNFEPEERSQLVDVMNAVRSMQQLIPDNFNWNVLAQADMDLYEQQRRQKKSGCSIF